MSPLDFDCKCAFHIKRRAELLEKLAAVEHEQWTSWTRYLLNVLKVPVDPITQARWRRQMETPYAQLPEKEKESDRVYARLVLAAFEE